MSKKWFKFNENKEKHIIIGGTFDYEAIYNLFSPDVGGLAYFDGSSEYDHPELFSTILIEPSTMFYSDIIGEFTWDYLYTGNVSGIFRGDISVEGIDSDQHDWESKGTISAIGSLYQEDHMQNGSCESEIYPPSIDGIVTWGGQFFPGEYQREAGGYSGYCWKLTLDNESEISVLLHSNTTSMHGLIPGHTYFLSSWYNYSSSGIAGIRIIETLRNQTIIYSGLSFPQNIGIWFTENMTFTINPNTVSIILEFFYRNIILKAGTVKIDNISLIHVTRDLSEVINNLINNNTNGQMTATGNAVSNSELSINGSIASPLISSNGLATRELELLSTISGTMNLNGIAIYEQLYNYSYDGNGQISISGTSEYLIYIQQPILSEYFINKIYWDRGKWKNNTVI